MAPLLHPKRELFAQHLATGMTQAAAYTAAGYKGEGLSLRAAAGRLAAQNSVRERVCELQAEQLKLLREQQAMTAQEAGIDLNWLQHSGKRLFEAAMEDKKYMAASHALERIAKISGLWADRAVSDNNQVLRIYSETELTEEEWIKLYCPNAQKQPDKPKS